MKLLKQKQQGLTLLELMVVVAVIGVLAAFAVPVYDDYTTRVKVAEGLHIAERAKTAVAVYYGENGSPPGSNTAAGLPAKTYFQTEYVKSVEVVSNGHILIEYLIGAFPDFDGGVDGEGVALPEKNVLKIEFQEPDDTHANIRWDCGSSTSPNATSVPDEFLPKNCQ